MKRRKTMLSIDNELIAAASQILGADRTQQTLDAALRSVNVANACRQAVSQLRSMRGLDLDNPEIMAGAWRD